MPEDAQPPISCSSHRARTRTAPLISNVGPPSNITAVYCPPAIFLGVRGCSVAAENGHTPWALWQKSLRPPGELPGADNVLRVV